MFEIQGKHNTAKVYAETIESEAYAQILELCNQESMKDQSIRLMPDCHAGAGCTIGTTIHITNGRIIPNLVGVDICCGVTVAELGDIDIDLEKFDGFIRNNIPMGFSIRKNGHRFISELTDEKSSYCLRKLRCAKSVNITKGLHSIGTLGGGNHFIELDTDESNNKYLVIHSGSRHLGFEVCKYYQNLAYKKLNILSAEARGEKDRIISELKAKGRQREIPEALEKLIKNTKFTSVPKDLTYLEGSDYSDYLYDMEILQRFADLNRLAMADDILKYLNINRDVSIFTTLHNYIDLSRNILRKGAVSAEEGEKLIIPMNMRDGSLICIGKGNPEWNYSAPHGAGRLMSRSKAKSSITLKEFQESMQGIYSSSVVSSVIDESSMAYKPMEAITSQIGETVTVQKIIKPIYNAKAKES